MKTKIPIEIIYTLLAGAGGMARHINQYLNGEKFDWHLLLANMFLSGFSGLMFALFARGAGLSENLIFVFSGVGGYMSTSSLEYIFKKIKK
jgi:hypothetical protein